MEPTKSSDGRALNAYRHGLTGQVQIRTQAEQAAYDEFCRGIHQSLAPVGALESSIAQCVADDRWRLHRAAALENDILALLTADQDRDTSGIPECDHALAQARAWLSRGKNIELLGLYEHRLGRHLEKNMAELRRLQAERRAALEKSFEEAELLVQLATIEGEPFDPTANAAENFPSNFVFSTREFERLFSRHRQLTEARNRISIPRKLPALAA